MQHDELSGLLFHGSYTAVSKIDLNIGVLKKDFGKGFYTTNSRNQAEKFARIKAVRDAIDIGFVSIFECGDSSGCKVKKFEKADLSWLNFVLFNRGFTEENKIDNDYDILIGPVANDTVGLVLNQLLVGTYGDPLSLEARETAIRLLFPEKLYNQVLFRTERSIQSLCFKEAYSVAINR